MLVKLKSIPPDTSILAGYVHSFGGGARAGGKEEEDGGDDECAEGTRRVGNIYSPGAGSVIIDALVYDCVITYRT